MEMRSMTSLNRVSTDPHVSDQCSEFSFDKQIVLNKDVNGVAITEQNVLLLALGVGTKGGLATLNIETEQLSVHQRGTPFRQIVSAGNGEIYTSTQDTIHTYDIYNLDRPKSVIKPGPNVWGLSATPDGQVVFSDVKQKKVYRRDDNANSLLVEKSEQNKMKSAWSLACSTDRLYISDRKKRQVVCTRADGSFLWRQKLGRPFPKYKKAVESMAYNYFGGVCTDTDGNLLVCDTANNALCKITPKGATSHYTGLELDKPAHVAINRGCLVVVNHLTMLDCVIKIYRQSTTL